MPLIDIPGIDPPQDENGLPVWAAAAARWIEHNKGRATESHCCWLFQDARAYALQYGHAALVRTAWGLDPVGDDLETRQDEVIYKLQKLVEHCLGPDGGEWSESMSPSEAGRRFNVTGRTFVRWYKAQEKGKKQKIRIKKLTTKAYHIHVDDLPKTPQQ